MVFDEGAESADIATNIIIGRIFESEITFKIPPSLKISESSSNGIVGKPRLIPIRSSLSDGLPTMSRGLLNENLIEEIENDKETRELPM